MSNTISSVLLGVVQCIMTCVLTLYYLIKTSLKLSFRGDSSCVTCNLCLQAQALDEVKTCISKHFRELLYKVLKVRSLHLCYFAGLHRCAGNDIDGRR